MPINQNNSAPSTWSRAWTWLHEVDAAIHEEPGVSIDKRISKLERKLRRLEDTH